MRENENEKQEAYKKEEKGNQTLIRLERFHLYTPFICRLLYFVVDWLVAYSWWEVSVVPSKLHETCLLGNIWGGTKSIASSVISPRKVVKLRSPRSSKSRAGRWNINTNSINAKGPSIEQRTLIVNAPFFQAKPSLNHHLIPWTSHYDRDLGSS